HILKSMLMTILGSGLFFWIFYQLYTDSNFLIGHGIERKNPTVFLLLSSLVISLYTYFLTPIFTWFSRKNEFEADKFAATYSNAEKLSDALLSLYRENSSTLTPSNLYWKFYYSHPPATKRIEYIKSLNT